MRKYQIYALYGGKNSENYLTSGTIQEIADYLGVKKDTAWYYQTNAWKKQGHQYLLVKLEGIKEYR